MKVIILIIVSYLIGSISFATLLAKMHGKDLRQIGSGNRGATNLARACGKKWAYLCFVLDVLKGFVPSITAKFVLIPASVTPALLALWLAVGTAAILGHIFPFYLKFRGGKGVATSFGVVLGIWPYYAIPGIICFVLWSVIVLTWRYISLGSIIAAAVFPLIMFVLTAALKDWHFNTVWGAARPPGVLFSSGIFLP